jgi:hypothetical protein
MTTWLIKHLTDPGDGLVSQTKLRLAGDDGDDIVAVVQAFKEQHSGWIVSAEIVEHELMTPARAAPEQRKVFCVMLNNRIFSGYMFAGGVATPMYHETQQGLTAAIFFTAEEARETAEELRERTDYRHDVHIITIGE